MKIFGRERPPRRRGGVPERGRQAPSILGSSPPTRGCSARGSRSLRRARVLPADAGVFRRRGCRTVQAVRPPRRRGGVPRPACAAPPRGPSSPPTRGCSAETIISGERPPVLPADAGVFRRRRPPAPPLWCPPRRRGGVPLLAAAMAEEGLSSPPTRGCSAARRGNGRGGPVLPADAGVFRSSGPRCPGAGRPPRRRGGVPPLDAAHIAQVRSSPPTRGVFRRGGRSRTSRAGPPRRRGGVPQLGGPTAYNHRSSPPTRGCSEAALAALRTWRVLPADAGVFRSVRGLHRHRRGPPRRRGGVPSPSRSARCFAQSSLPTRGCSASG